jgi:hypothetical protein
MTVDDQLTHASFRQARYLVSPELGAVVTLGRELTEEELEAAKASGYELVTKKELFSRWPVWKQTFQERGSGNKGPPK